MYLCPNHIPINLTVTSNEPGLQHIDLHVHCRLKTNLPQEQINLQHIFIRVKVTLSPFVQAKINTLR